MSGLKIKNLAQRYGVSSQEIAKELDGQGIKADKVSGLIPVDMTDLVEDYFAELYSKKSQNKSGTQANGKTIELSAPFIVKDLAEALSKKPNEIISDLMRLGELASINQAISESTAKKICKNYGYELVLAQNASNNETEEKAVNDPFADDDDEEIDPSLLSERPPVVTFLGHVDHGKTSLQDAVRHTNVVGGEAGRITQHIGASTVNYNGKIITFIDTPGHEAFTAMRARGANSTDIAVLVVSASEGFKPQTVEAMNHALAAKVPIIVAMNKIDLPEADPEKILLQMSQHNLLSEAWGGSVGAVQVSAKTGKGLNDLLDRVLLEAEVLELKANAKCQARGVVLESQLEQGLGPTASVLIQKGTLKPGDAVICGEATGKVRSLLDDKGKPIKSAGPSIPVKLIGLDKVPNAGDRLFVCASEKLARQEAGRRVAARRDDHFSHSSIVTADDLFSKLNSSAKAHLNLLIKSDVRGSGEAIAQSLGKLPSEKIKAEVIMNGVGAIAENDVMLASASGAIIVGFHVRVNPGVNELAKKKNVEIRLYSIIYELLEDITDALSGKLEPEKREHPLGSAEILQIFALTKGPKICGCMVNNGSIKVGAKARVFRNGDMIYNGSVASLRRFQDDVKEVKSGLECGIRLDNFNDFEVKDTIECYEVELKKASL